MEDAYSKTDSKVDAVLAEADAAVEDAAAKTDAAVADAAAKTEAAITGATSTVTTAPKPISGSHMASAFIVAPLAVMMMI